MTDTAKKLAFLLATSPYLDTLDGKYETAAEDLVANGVVLVRHSFWEEYDTSSFGGYKDGEAVWWKRKFFRCERCRKGSVVRSKYCPNCGAKMDGDSHE